MANEIREAKVSLCVYDSDHLPPNLSMDAVFDHFQKDLKAFVKEWYLMHMPLVEFMDVY